MGFQKFAQSATVFVASLTASVAPSTEQTNEQLNTTAAITSTFTPEDARVPVQATQRQEAQQQDPKAPPVAVPGTVRSAVENPQGVQNPNSSVAENRAPNVPTDASVQATLMRPQGTQPNVPKPERDLTNPVASYDPFGTAEHRALVESRMREQIDPSLPDYVPPANIRALHEKLENNQVHTLAIDDLANEARHRAGLEPRDRDILYRLQAKSPREAAEFAVQKVENALWRLGEHEALPGLTLEQTGNLLRMRSEYQLSGTELAGRDPAAVKALHEQYQQACLQYCREHIYNGGVHDTLARHALQGFNSPEAAKRIEETLESSTLTTQQRREALIEIAANAGVHGLPALARDYAALPLQSAGEQYYTALANKDVDAIRSLLSPRSQHEATAILSYADRYAKERNLADLNTLQTALSPEQYAAVAEAQHGFDARTQALEAYRAWNSLIGVDEAGIRTALGYIKDAAGNERSIYSAEQIAQIRTQLAAVATEKGSDPVEVVSKCENEAAAAINNPTALTLLTQNLHQDLRNSGTGVESNFALISTSISHGFDGAMAAEMLHSALDRGDGTAVLAILNFGSDPERSKKDQYLSADDERYHMIRAYDALYDDPTQHTDQNLVEGIRARLSGDQEIQALQIVEQGFFAGREALAVKGDLQHIHRLIDPRVSLEDNVQRIAQTNNEFVRRNGTSMSEAVRASSLPDAEKDMLLSITMLPEMATLNSSLKQANPDPAVIAGLLDVPRMEAFYDSTFGAQPGAETLRANLERIAVEGKLTREFVIEQELELSGMPANSMVTLAAELDPANPTIGNESSLIRKYRDEQLDMLEHGFNFIEQGKAQTEGRQPQTLEQVVAARLDGDAEVQALQILEQRFYATERAQGLTGSDQKLGGLLNVVDPERSLEQNIARVQQTDVEYRKLTGRGLGDAVEQSNLPEPIKESLLTIARLPELSTLQRELSSPSPSAEAIQNVIGVPRIERLYNAIHAPDENPALQLRGRLEQAGIDGSLPRPFVIEQQLRLSGLPTDTVKRLESEIDPASVTIGTETSVLRSLSPKQIELAEHLYNYAEQGRAEARGAGFVDLRASLLQLNEAGKLSEQQLLRAAMTLSGNDPWKIADQLDANRLQSVAVLSAMEPVFMAEIRDVYKEKKGDLLLRAVINDRSVAASFKNDTEYGEWVDSLTTTLYGAGISEQALAIHESLSAFGTPNMTPEQTAQAVGRLQSSLEGAAQAGTIKNAAEVYEAYFGSKDKLALVPQIDELVQRGVLTPEQQKYLKSMIEGNPH